MPAESAMCESRAGVIRPVSLCMCHRRLLGRPSCGMNKNGRRRRGVRKKKKHRCQRGGYSVSVRSRRENPGAHVVAFVFANIGLRTFQDKIWSNKGNTLCQEKGIFLYIFHVQQSEAVLAALSTFWGYSTDQDD